MAYLNLLNKNRTLQAHPERANEDQKVEHGVMQFKKSQLLKNLNSLKKMSNDKLVKDSTITKRKELYRSTRDKNTQQTVDERNIRDPLQQEKDYLFTVSSNG